MISFTPEKALIFRITHIDNVRWILSNGLHCCNSGTLDPGYVEIGNPDLIARRSQRQVPIPPGGLLSDYLPFYFTPYTPMLYNIHTGYQGIKQRPMSEIAILVASLRTIKRPFVFTDRHAVLETARFFSSLEDLDKLDWKLWQERDFKRSPDDLGKLERYQAEALIHRFLPVTALAAIVCYNETQGARLNEEIQRQSLALKALIRPDLYL
jgi:hypothetical protein